MDLLFTLLIPSSAITLLVYFLIWSWRGQTQPIFAGALCMLIGVIVALVPVVFFGVSYSEASYGLILLIPTWPPLFFGIVALIFGLFKGRRLVIANLKTATELFLDDPNQKP
jgi:uncharacterized membrane protein HdeD (DUF308 family)